MNTISMPRGWLDLPALRAGRGPFDRMSAYAYLWDRAFQRAGNFTLEGYTVHLERGQFAASTRFLGRAWGWDERSVRRFLNRLKAAALIDTDTAAGLTRITICNYSEIQDGSGDGAAPSDTVAAAEAPHYRRKTEESKTHNNVPETRDSPEGVQGEGREKRPHRESRQWSPKVDDPRQLDLITDTALGESTPAPVEVLAPESIVPPVALSLEGEVMPPEAEVIVPEVIPAGEAAAAPAPAKRNNVVKLHPDTDPDFQRWYATYPRHKKPIDAAKAYAEARRRASASELLEGAHRCREEAEAMPPEKRRFVPYPGSWLRAGGWMEEAEGLEVNSIEGRGNGKHYDNRRETGPNVNARVIAAILERCAEGS